MDKLEARNFIEPKINEQLRQDTVLWRYLDAAKLFDFFENSTLFFCRADHFSDKFEGAFTPSLRQQIEKEVRVIIDRTGHDPIPERVHSGIVVKIDVTRLLRSIVIAPDAPPWFEQLVRQSAQRYGVKAPVRRSKLATDPI